MYSLEILWKAKSMGLYTISGQNDAVKIKIIIPSNYLFNISLLHSFVDCHKSFFHYFLFVLCCLCSTNQFNLLSITDCLWVNMVVIMWRDCESQPSCDSTYVFITVCLLFCPFAWKNTVHSHVGRDLRSLDTHFYLLVKSNKLTFNSS